MIELTKLNDGNHIGLLYALTEDTREYVYATEAEKGSNYICPICYCKMQIKTYQSGLKLFARNPGAIHINSECIAIEQQKTKKSFNGLTPERFIGSLCRTIPRKKEKLEDENGGHTVRNLTKESSTIPTYVAPFSSLRDIAKGGLFNLKPTSKQGDYQISDFILTYQYGFDFFEDLNFTLGARIIYAKYSSYDKNNNYLKFNIFKKEKCVQLNLRVPNDTTFKELSKKLFKEPVIINNKVCSEKKEVLVAAQDWQAYSDTQLAELNNTSKGKTKYLRAYLGTLTNQKQIYIL